ncbi:hypothetical protein HOLleu_19276 [Holothuria leucospilota]|uniref:Uncharacterized protein n=1 Tax=Holothuria leucospilota TaxID=206669 RepID=A0A9Q1BZ02_HOLLE|nr:hypothetical protein HOLleu_19276 [Holothuria leucospilota]
MRLAALRKTLRESCVNIVTRVPMSFQVEAILQKVVRFVQKEQTGNGGQDFEPVTVSKITIVWTGLINVSCVQRRDYSVWETL